MREEMKKLLFIGVKEDKKSFFQRAQERGLVHFIDPHLSGRPDTPPIIHQITSAIKVLRGLPPTEQEENYASLDTDEIVRSILSLSQSNEQFEEEQRVLAAEISRIHVFGDFSFNDIAYIENKGKCKIQFFCARPNLFDNEPPPENLIYTNSEHGLDYYIAINDHPITYDKINEMKFEQ